MKNIITAKSIKKMQKSTKHEKSTKNLKKALIVYNRKIFKNFIKRISGKFLKICYKTKIYSLKTFLISFLFKRFFFVNNHQNFIKRISGKFLKICYKTKFSAIRTFLISFLLKRFFL